MIHEVDEQVTEYKVVIPKSIIFLNTSIRQLEIEIKKKIPFTISKKYEIS